MSIIIGFVNKTYAVVASDGRISTGALYEGETLIAKSIIQSDEFDKTFSFKNGKLIGAVSGIMRFKGKSTIEHIESIVNENNLSPFSMGDLAKKVCEGLKQGLLNTSSEEILFRFRSIDLILIGPKSDSDYTNQLKSCRINPDETLTNIEYTVNTIDPISNDLAHYQIFGDDAAQSIVNPFLQKEIGLCKKIDADSLRSISYKAIRLGIKNSTSIKHGDHKSCGGKVYVKNIT
jgi:hypothetical protein